MKRVLIYSDKTLFGSGISKLIDAEPTLTVVGWETDIEQALIQILELQPDIILSVSRAYSMSDGQRFLQAGANAKVVELTLEDNTALIYASTRIAIEEADDLVKIIEHTDIISALRK